MNVRIATENDADALARLNNRFNKTNDTAQQVAARIKAIPLAETALVAELEGSVVGFACLRITRSLCYDFALAELTELYVEEGYRRRGVGRALVEQAERLAQERGAASLILLVGRENLSGQEFYRSIGYQVSPDLVMSKRLSGAN
ncbi:MAG TPA: GNAT family N-acetyltransferase [Blastocatellia bacterium]|nr:GNAT family N-acetyltransferase [Blastocatellia bacterium]